MSGTPTPERPGRPPGGRTESWSRLRARLESVGFRPSRRLGQNFLLDTQLCAWIARVSGVRPGETVLEVGVGLGFLTGPLLGLGARVVGIEIDDRLAAIARERLAPAPGLTLLEVDVLAGKHALAPELLAALPPDEPWSLVSNLPYAVGSPVLALLARLERPPRTMTVLVQAEVAERLCAAAGESAWGPLSARLAPVYRSEFLRRVPPGSFRPRPKVDSAVVRLDLREDRPGPERLAAYDRLVSALFQARRKRARTPLAALVGGLGEADRLLAAVGIEREARVDQLEPERLLTLSAAVADPGAGADAGPGAPGRAPGGDSEG